MTAKHLLAAELDSPRLEIFAEGAWRSLPTSVVGHSQEGFDVSVLSAQKELTSRSLPVTASMAGMAYGQEAFFLGFPYRIAGVPVGSHGYPLPMVKRATLSMFNGATFLLDGHNNPGFSGGPVVFRPPGQDNFAFAGVVSGFIHVDEPVYGGKEVTPLVFKYNTGIMHCHSIKLATDLIAANPCGFILD